MKTRTTKIDFSVRLLLALSLLLAACGGGGSGGGGTTTPVGIRLKIPAAAAAANKTAFAPSPAAVTQLRIGVNDAAGAVLTSVTLGATPGEEVTIRLQVPAGPARLFIIEALDGGGVVLFRGEASADLAPDTPASILIQMAAVARPSITLSPATAFVLAGTGQTFTAQLTGMDDQSIVWSVNGIEGGDGSVGSITQTNPATYTAPAARPDATLLVKAAAKADPALFAVAAVTILTPETTLFIDGSAGADGAGCGTRSSPCRSITRGLAGAKAGQTLRVAPGTYDDTTEIFPILMKPGIDLVGATPGERPVITSGRPVPVAVVAADGTALNGFTLDPNDGSIDTLISVDAGAPTISENQLIDRGCPGLCRASGTGIKITGGTPVITGNEFIGFGYLSSDPFDAAVALLDRAAPTLSGNNFHDNETGIALFDGATARIEGNTLLNNNVGISILNASNPDLGGGERGSVGGNRIGCNRLADLTVAETAPAVHAQRNFWDHLPPTLSAAPGSGIDIVAARGIDAAEPGVLSPRCLTEAPTAPSPLLATARSQTQISLSWSPSVDNAGEITYQIERCRGTSCTGFAQITTTTDIRFDDAGLLPATAYSYRVRAVDLDDNLSPYSNTAGATTPDQGAPTPPSNLTATAVGETQINLSWDPASDDVGVAGYRLERCQGATCAAFLEIAQPTGTVFSDTGRSPSTAYRYRVRAVDAAGNFGGYSNTATGTTSDTTAPTAPGGLTANAVSEIQVNLSWNRSTDNVGLAGYRVERCQGTACADFVEIARTTAAAFSDAGRAPATPYRYRVRAVDLSNNFSGYSNIAAATTPDRTPPTAPVNLVANAVGAQINLSWGASTDNVGVTDYRVERCLGALCANFGEIAQTTNHAFNDTGLLAVTAYRYRVRAVDAAGNFSGYSNIVTAATLDTAPPTPPSGLSARGLNQSDIGLSWNPSTDNVGIAGYRLERCLATGAGCVEIDTGSAGDPTKPSFNDAGLATATAYTYRVRAYDAAGNLSLYSQSAGASTGRILFTANFDADPLDRPPDPTLAGDPVGDALSLNTSAGTILVRSAVGGLDKKPVELNQTGGTGGVTLRGAVAGTPPRSGIYTARWRSVVASREVGFASIVLRDSAGRILASLAYRPGNILDYNDRRPNGIGVGWQALTPQDFSISVDLTNKLTTLRINGRIVLEDRYFEPAAEDLAQISMELGTTGTQTLGWDDIDIIATAP